MLRILIVLLILIPTTSSASSMKMIGVKGNLEDVTKVVTVKMFDNYYEPNLIKVKKGETIKFIIKNLGDLVHEYNIGTKEMHMKHQPEMQRLVDYEILLVDKIDKAKMKKMSKKDHSLAHSHSNSVMLEPNKTGEIIWKFTKNLNLQMACNIPGHYESGMYGKIVLE